MAKIHPTAIIDSKAELAQDVEIGPYVVVQGRVEIGAGTMVGAHSVLHGHAVIGSRCRIGPAAYVGLEPQHLGYRGEETSLIVGDETVIRETAQLHRSMKPGIENATRVGRRCFFMSGSHVGHDCRLEDDIVQASGALLGGHCVVGARVFLGGGCVIHQFVRIGRLAIVGGNEAITQDVPPFGAVRYSGLRGYNSIGCKRSGLSREAIAGIRAAYGSLHRHRSTPTALAEIARQLPMPPEVAELVEFIRTSRRGVLRSLKSRGANSQSPDED